MKKIFTLIFSLGLLTAAFAQGGHSQRGYNSNNGSGNQSSYQDNRQKYGGHQATPYSNSDNWNYQSSSRGNSYHYNSKVNNRNGFGDRDDMRGKFDNNRFNDQRFNQEMNNYRPDTYKKKLEAQTFFSFGSHHK